MSLSDLFRSHGPHVANIVALQKGQRIGSGTGFIVNGHLVTCAHVMKVPAGCNLEVRFERPPSGQFTAWTYTAFGDQPTFCAHSDEHSYDYAVIKPPSGLNLGTGLKVSKAIPDVGEPVCCLGYPFEDPHLTIHQGIVSAVFTSGVATMLKLDMSINPSNSGGPLIRVSDGTVIGVVARKATGLSRSFDELMKNYDSNISALQGSIGIMGLVGIDPIAVLLAGQHQMKVVSTEIARSANVGIGYAIHAVPLVDEAALT